MGKYLYVTFPGEKYRIDIEIINEHRAKELARDDFLRNKYDLKTALYDPFHEDHMIACKYISEGAEIYLLPDDHRDKDKLLYNWAQHNMKWSNLKRHAERVYNKSFIDYDALWKDCHKILLDSDVYDQLDLEDYDLYTPEITDKSIIINLQRLIAQWLPSGTDYLLHGRDIYIRFILPFYFQAKNSKKTLVVECSDLPQYSLAFVRDLFFELKDHDSLDELKKTLVILNKELPLHAVMVFEHFAE